MRRSLHITLSFAFCTLLSSAQILDQTRIIGIWQERGNLPTEDWLNTYRFFQDGKFVFTFNRMAENRRLYSIQGTYELQSDSVHLTVLSFDEFVGGELVRGAWEIGEWLMKSQETRQQMIKKPLKTTVLIEECTEYKSSEPCVLFDTVLYVKIKDDPNEFP